MGVWGLLGRRGGGAERGGVRGRHGPGAVANW